MRYDADRQVLELSVRELAYERERGLVAPAFNRLRTELGNVVHRRIQAELEPGQTEVPLWLEREIDGVTCRVRGRADVVRRDGDGWLIEEIKSVVEHVDARDDASARLQVQLYVLARIEEAERAGVRPEPIAARLVFVEIQTDVRRTVDVDFDRDAVARRLEQGLRDKLALALARAQLEQARRASAGAIRFPFASARPGQDRLIATIEDALARERPVMLAAPTGTGKTVVALVPALREGLRRGAAVWFLTAKTTQRALAAETFAAIQRASGIELRAVVTRRKQDMCPPGHLRCHPSTCSLLDGFDERAGPVLQQLGDEPLLTPEHLLARGRATRLCPYELMHARIEQADLVVADYAHVYDPRRSRAYAGRRLVIVDEAHNLVDRAREMASVFVPRHAAALELVAVARIGPALAELGRDVAAIVDEHLREAALDERPTHEGQTTVELDREVCKQLGIRAGVLALGYAHARAAVGELETDDPVLEALQAIAFLGELASDPDPALLGTLAGPDAPGGAGVGISCLDPGRRLERLHRSLAGVLAMSATLEPLDYFADVLGLARLEPAQVRAPSTFPPEHRCVCVVTSVRTTFGERDASAPAIAACITKVLAARSGNYAAFFPSFRFLATVSAALDRGALSGVDILIQPPGASEAIRSQFLARLRRDAGPTLLLAVTGGVFGEGVDLPHEALIGAIVVGPALPPPSFERLAMQDHHQRVREAGFAYAMVYPGMQRVIQAAGRVHRTPDDRGVIVLLGARFAAPPYCEALPEHWYDHAPDELICEDLDALSERLHRFWR